MGSQPVWVPVLTDKVELKLPFIEQLPASLFPRPQSWVKEGHSCLRLRKASCQASGPLPRAPPSLPQPSLTQLSLCHICIARCPNAAEPLPQLPPSSLNNDKIRKHSDTVCLLPTCHGHARFQRGAGWAMSLASLDKQNHPCLACTNTHMLDIQQ